MKNKTLKKLTVILVLLLILSNIGTSVFAMNLYSRKSTDNSKSSVTMDQIIAGLFRKTNTGTVSKGDTSLEPSTTPDSTVSGETISKFSPEQIKDLTDGLKQNTSSDKITLVDVIKFIYRIMKTYSNVNTGAQTISQSKQLAVLTSVNSATDGTGPITVTPAKVNNEEYTLITLGGTEFLEGQATGIKEDLLCGTEQINDYLVDVVNIFSLKDSNNNPVVPKDKPIIVTGISLGGMIAQQLLSQESLSEYNIKYVVCFGSPIIAPTSRRSSTTIVRLCDKNDIVPYLGATFILDEIKQNVTGSDPSQVVTQLDSKEKKVEDGKYKSFIGAHALSYVDGSCWNGYDVLGVKGGSAILTLEDAMKFYDAPTLSQSKSK